MWKKLNPTRQHCRIHLSRAHVSQNACLRLRCPHRAGQQIMPAVHALATRAAATAASEQELQIRIASGEQDVQQAAMLMAEAFYEDQPYTRFVGSFKRQLAERFAKAITQYADVSKPSAVPQRVCLVAGHAEQVMAVLDLVPPMSATGQGVSQLPQEEEHGAYVLNVAVAADSRGRGVGFALLLASAEHALREWQAQRLYTKVELHNEVALALYAKCGFAGVPSLSPDMVGAPEAKLGQERLLVADLPLACTL